MTTFRIRHINSVLLVPVVFSQVLAQAPDSGAVDIRDLNAVQIINSAPTVSSDLAPTVAELEKRLWTRKMDLAADKMPLSEVLEHVGRVLECDYKIDRRDWSDPEPDPLISIQLRQVAVGSVLETILGSHQSFQLQPGRIVVSSTKTAKLEKEMPVRIYPVADLVVDGLGEADYESLIEVVTTTIDPESWEELGGAGSVVPFQNCLTIRQTDANHRQITRLLEILRHVQQQPNDEYDVSPRLVAPLADTTQTLRQRLETQKITAQWQGGDLPEIVDWLRDKLQVSIALWREPTERFSPPDASLHRWHDAPGSRVLDDIAEASQLEWFVKGDIVYLADTSLDEKSLQVRCYPVRDLVRLDVAAGFLDLEMLDPWFSGGSGGCGPFGGGAGCMPRKPYRFNDILPFAPSDHSLIEMLISSVDSFSWEDYGGPGSIAFFPAADCLVVSQTQKVHEEITNVLHEIREQRATADLQQIRQNVQQFLSTVEIRRYWGSDQTSDELQNVRAWLVEQVAPDTWDSDEYSIQVLNRNLIVRHRRDVLWEVDQYLIPLEFQAEPVNGELPARRHPAPYSQQPQPTPASDPPTN